MDCIKIAREHIRAIAIWSENHDYVSSQLDDQ
jgi:hypothetical protein